jgi:polyhydroxybutyrate depolymerase
MTVGLPRSFRGWLAWGLVLLAVLLLLGAARRSRGDGAPADSDGEPNASATPSVEATADGTTAVVRPAAGASSGSLVHDGRERTWRLYVPESLPASGEVPLLVGLHGGLGSGEQFAESSHFDDEAEQGGFIAVYPDGIRAGRLLAARTWNAGNCCGTAVKEGVDDVGFIDELVEELLGSLPIDPDRVYVTGHSNGAMMAQRMACERPDLVAAIAVYSGPLEAPCAPSEPVSVLNIHGDADENVPIDGGNGPRAVSNTDYHSLAETVETWVAVNGCDATPEVTIIEAVTTSTWGGCTDGVVVQTQIVAGASHAWPGGARTGLLRPSPSDAIDATAAIWEFLATKRR